VSPAPLVLHVLEALEGGTARHVADVTRWVEEVRHEVVVPPRRVGGVTDEQAVDVMRDNGAVVHLLDMRRQPLRPENAVAVARLAALVRRRHPDIVHAHSTIGGIVGRIASLSAPTRRVYTAHALAPGRGPLAVERGLGRFTDRWIAVSPSEADLVRRHRIIAPESVAVIPNGIDLDPPPPVPGLRSSMGIPADVPLIGCLARLVPQKDPLAFVRLCRHLSTRLPNARFLLIGSGPLRAEVERLVDASGLRVTFLLRAFLPHAALALGELDVFVLTSRFEGCPYSALEAIRAGVPVVLSDVVGNRDVVESGVSGVLVPPGDDLAAAAAVAGLLADPELRLRLVAGGRARLARRFDVHIMAGALGRLYAELSRSEA